MDTGPVSRQRGSRPGRRREASSNINPARKGRLRARRRYCAGDAWDHRERPSFQHEGTAVATETPGPAPAAGPADDPLPEAVALARGATEAGLGLKLLGGLAIRVLCPAFPPRLRPGQDMDFACLSKGRKNVVAYLERSGCQPDRRFNNLNGDRQMYFNAPSGRPIDVMVDRLTMCHTLDFRPSFSSSPGSASATLDPADLLLTKLQIVELNAKDAHDIFHLLSGVRVGPDGTRPFIDPDRFGSVLSGDWGWWRTVTGSLA